MNVTLRGVLAAAIVALLAACDAHDHSGFTAFGRAEGGRIVLHSRSAPDALLGADGSLSIDGQPVAVTPAQQALLRSLHEQVETLQHDAVATGKAGAATAAATMSAVAEGLSNHDPESIGPRVDAAAAKVEAGATKICTDLAALRATQQTLAAQLPAFAPYASINAGEVSDCNGTQRQRNDAS